MLHLIDQTRRNLEMRFEIPTMNISMFEVENVVTNGSDPTTPAETPKSAETKATAIAETITKVNDNILTFH